MSVTLVDAGQVGLVSQAVGVDRWIGIASSQGNDYISFFYSLGDNPAGGGDTVIEVTDTPGGGGNTVTITIPDGQTEAAETSSLQISALGQVFRRVVQAPPNALNLSGYVSAVVVTGGGGVAPIGGDLCSLADVKRNLNLTITDHDAMLADLISGVSQAIQSECRRILTPLTWSQFFYPSGLTTSIVLPHWPADPDPMTLIVKDGDHVLDSATDIRLEGTRRIRRIASGYPCHWSSGQVQITWNAGHAIVPSDLTMAACDQVSHEFNLQRAGGNAWMGQQSKTTNVGGTEAIITNRWLPHVNGTIAAYRRRF